MPTVDHLPEPEGGYTKPPGKVRVRTKFRPYEEIEVREAEAAVMRQQGLLVEDEPEKPEKTAPDAGATVKASPKGAAGKDAG
jgi:hypothetical protein